MDPIATPPAFQASRGSTAPPASSTSALVDCQHAARCGGCPLIDLPYDTQLAQKRERVVVAVGRHPALSGLAIRAIASAEPIVEYRTRAKLIVGPEGELGLFAQGGGHHVVDIPRCRVLTMPLARAAAALREQVAAARAGTVGTAGGTGAVLAPVGAAGGALRAVDIREVKDGGEARVLVTYVVDRKRVPDLAPLREAAADLMRRAPEVLGVAANFHVGDVPQVLGAETTPLAGAASAPDRMGGSVQLASFGSFVQAHRGQAARVHAAVAEAVGIGRALRPAPGARRARVLDVYGGSGSIALGLAAAGAKVTLIESFAPAVEQARAAARAQNVEFDAVCADAAVALRTLAAAETRERFDAVVVNPPRRGTSPAVREQIAQLAPATLVYVSCDPETLTRDLAHLAILGYAAESLQPLDMIPLTEEVETVAVLRRGLVPSPAVIYEDGEVLVVEKGSHEPTIPQGEYAGSLLARVRQIPGAESAVPVHRLEAETSGLAIFARDARNRPQWQRALAADSTRLVFIAAVRGVAPTKGVVARGLREGDHTVAAKTRYRRLAIASGHAVLRVVPEQGLPHQVRRHLSAIGHPVLGDERFGHEPTNRYFEEKHGLDRTFLHAARLEIRHPTSGASLVLDAPLAGDLRAVLERMGGGETIRFLDGKKPATTKDAATPKRAPTPPTTGSND